MDNIKAVIEKYPDIKILDAQDGQNQRAPGQQIMEDYLTRYPAGQIDMVWAQNDEMGLGALKGAFSGLKGAMGAWKAAGGLAGQGGLRGVVMGAGKNLAASLKSLMSKVPGFRPTTLAGGGASDWMQFAEDVVEGGSGVVAQLTPDSCVSAVGEMLSKGEISQLDLMKALTPNGGRADYSLLAAELGEGWRGGFPAALKDFAGLGPVGLTLKSVGQDAHFVLAEAVDPAANAVVLRVLDPWPPGVGTTYTIALDKIEQYVMYVVFRG